MSGIKTFDVLISGAGPAGTTAAMALEKSGLKVALLDKAVFPRDKICGDFVAIKGLREIFKIKPELKEHFANYPKKAVNRSTEFYIDRYKPLTINWVTTSYNIRRVDFDNELMLQVKKAGIVEVFEDAFIKEVFEIEKGYELTTAKGQTFRTTVLIGADGAHSVVAKKLAGYKLDKNYYGGSVRAYYKGLQHIDSKVNEVYMYKGVVPGYFWLFPLSNGEANVGLGMQSNYIAKHKVNLKELMVELIETHPELKKRFANAKLEGKIEGFGLPFYSKKYPLSGKNFMLVGDAGNLMDPSNGEGIMPAIYSGKFAAEYTVEAFEKQNFSSDFLKKYEDKVHATFWPEMRVKSWVGNNFLTNYQFLKFIGYLSEKTPLVANMVKKIM